MQYQDLMKCAICQFGETEPGTTTVTLTRGEMTVVIRDVPAQICTTCGEEYVDAATGKRLSQIAETALSEGVQVDIRHLRGREGRSHPQGATRPPPPTPGSTPPMSL